MRRLIDISFLLPLAFILASATLSFSQPVFTIQNKKDACNNLANGSFDILVTGGTGTISAFVFSSGAPIGPIAITLNVPANVTGLSGTVAGRPYLIVVSDANGSSVAITTIFLIPNISASLVSATNSSSCLFPNGSIDINATGGTGSYTYAWTSSNGFTSVSQDISGLVAGNYTVVVSDNGTNCSQTLGPISITQPPPPAAPTVTFSPSSYCVGATITAPIITTPTGGSTYTWYSDAGLTTVLTTGTAPTNVQLGFSSASVNIKTVYVKETNSLTCSGPATAVTLTVNAVPVAPTVAFSPSSYCVGAVITAPTITAPVGGSIYTWYSDVGLTTVLTTGTTPTNVQLGFSSVAANTKTVYVTETNSGNCKGPATVITLTVNALPVAPGVTFSPSSYCVGATITAPTITTPTGGSTYTWYSDAGLTTVLTTGTAPTNVQLGFSSASVNIKTVYVKETNSLTCSGPATAVTLTVNAIPVAPTVAFSPSSYCVGAVITAPTITAPVGGSIYTWYSDVGLTTVLTTGTTPTNVQLGFSSVAANTKTVYVTETNSGNCKGPATVITLTVNALPVAPGVTFSPSSYCVGATITAPIITTPTGGSTYTWYSDAGLTTVLTTGTAPTNVQLGFSSASVNIKTVYVKETNSLTCSGPATAVTLTVNAVPVAPTVAFSPSSYCVGAVITAPTITAPVGGSIYTWYSDVGLTTVLTTGTTPTNVQLGFSSVAANTKTVYVTETNSGNCKGPATVITLTVNALPVAPGVTFSPSSYCVGATITAPTITTPTGGSTYTWYSDAGLTTVLTTGTAPTNVQLGFSSVSVNIKTVYVKETNSLTCSGPATAVTLTVNAIPVAPTVAFSPSSYCVGAVITAPTITAPVGGSIYTWYSDVGLTTVLTTGTTPTNVQLGFSSVAANTKTVYVTETNSGNCKGPATVITLTVNALPVAPGVTFSPSSYCVGATITAPIITTPTGGSTYTWYSDAGLTTVLTTGTAPTNVQLGFSSASVNIKTVYVKETNSLTCSGPATAVTLTVNAVPVAPTVAFSPSSYCVGAVITAPTITAPVGGSIYTWYSDVGLTTVLTTGTTPTNVQLGFSSVAANTKTVYATETNSGNCKGPATVITLTVNALPVAPGVTFSPSSYCVGATITAPIITTPTGGSTYTWYSDAGLTTVLTTGTAPTNVQLGFSSAAANTTTVYITETNSSNCKGPATVITLTVNALPVAPGVTFSPSSYCVGATITAPTITTPTGGSTYTWYSDVGLTIILTTGTAPTNAQLGFSSASVNTKTVYVKETNSLTCSGPATAVTLTVNAVPVAPTVSFSPSSYCVGATIIAPTITAPVGGSTYTWYSDAGLTTVLTTGATPTNVQLGFSSAAANTTTVYVTETNSTTCSGPAFSITLTVLGIPAAPAVTFTPNSYCEGATITPPVITTPIGGSTYTWYSDAGLTTVLTTGTTPTNALLGFSSAVANTTAIFVTETNSNNCAGPATSITLTVNANPLAPAVTFSPSGYCVGATITPPVIASPAGGSTYTWYSDVGLTTVLTTGTTPTNIQLGFSSAIANTTTIYVAETNSSNCLGPAALVTLTVNSIPATPAVTFTPNTYCVGATITAPTITTPTVGSTYTWYSDAGLTNMLTTGTSPTNVQLGFSSTIVNSTAVFVTETNTSCTGAASMVTLTVSALPTVSVSGSTTICNGQSANLTFDFTGTGPWAFQYSDGVTTLSGNSPTSPATISVNPTANTTYTLVNVSDANCTGTITGSPVIINVDNVPSAGLVVSTTLSPICTGGSSTIEVANSEVGVNYQLRNNADNSLIGSVVPGTGGTISLPTGVLVSTTVFNVVATRGVCAPVQLTSTGTITVLAGTINAALGVIALASNVCEGSGTMIQISNSETGIDYQLRDDSDNSLISTPVSGTGGNISLPTGNLSQTTKFNVLASNGACFVELTNVVTVNVDINPNPALTLGSTISPLCIGGVSAVTVSNSEVGVNYQLRDNSDNSLVGISVPGTGAIIELTTGVLSASKTFNVLATGGVCTPVQLAGTTAIVVAGSINLSLAVTPTSSLICSGSSTDIQIANSEVGVDYRLIDAADNSFLSAVLAGTGGTLSVSTGILNSTKDIHVLITNGSCAAELTSTAIITVNPLPITSLAVNALATTLCSGVSTQVQIVNSEAGVTYQLRDDADDSIVSGAVIGNGSTINLPTGPIAATKTFNVLATNGTCSLELTSTVTVTVNNAPDETLSVVALDPAICSGKSTSIQVLNSEAGIIYQLRDNADNSIVSGATFGNGGTINLPTGPVNANRTFNVSASNTQCTIQLLNTVTVTARAINDPLCSNCSTVVVSTINPIKVTCGATIPDGGITFKIEPPDPLVNSIGVKIQINGPTPKTQTNDFVFTGLAAGNYTYTITYGDPNNPDCIKTGFFLIESKGFPDPIIFDLAVNEFNCRTYEGSIKLQNIEGAANTQFEFTVISNGTTITQGTIPASAQSFTISDLLLGDYEVQLSQNQEPSNGCVGIVASQSVAFSIEQPAGGCGIFIPNIFTPNADGVNDSFLIRELPANSSVTITNRWGKEVYSSSDYKNNWTAENLSDGIYYYRIVADSEIINGWVEVLR